MEQEQRIAELEAKVVQLSELFEGRETPPRSESSVEATSSRRGMLKLAGAAAVGVVAATVGGVTSAAADDGLTINAGANTSTANPTKVRYTGAAGATDSAFVFDSGGFGGNTSFHPATLAGWTANSATRPASGVYGFTQNPDGFGVIGRSDAAAGGIGVHGLAANGTGVTAEGSTGMNIHGTSGGGIIAGDAGDGLLGIGAGAGSAGLRGLSGDFSIAANLSTKANLFLQPNNSFFSTSLKTPPLQRTDAHVVGEIDNVDGDLWMCVANGTPGTWKKITGTGVAGAFHAISPSRVYDSRSAAPSPGALASGANRLVSVADKRDLGTGAVTVANVVPAGATAISVNLTVANTVNTGFLAVNEGGNTVVAASAINWSSSGQAIANGIIVPVNATRQVTVIAGGGGTTDFILDVSGYYL
jgi:hypothetical protein